MAKNVEIPSMGESVTEATLLRWRKNDGDRVQVDEALCELETDKANVDLPSPVAGVLRRLKKEGDTVRVGETIATIDEAGASQAAESPSTPRASAPPKAAPPPPQPAAAKAPATSPKTAEGDLRPSVRRIAEEKGIDPKSVTATGPGGVLLKEDLLRHLEAGGGASAPSKTEVPPLPFPPFPGAPGASLESSAPAFDEQGIQRQPMTKIRKRIAERLVAAKLETAMLTTFNEVDMSEVLALRAKYKDRFQEQHGVGLGLMSFFSRAVVLALKAHPVLNASIDGSDIVFHNHVHLGIAVSTERGLIVPVLKNAEKLGFAKIESEIRRMATAAREGKLGLNELSSGTFTITNGGVFGSLLSTPILNSPQSGILGMHSIQKRPVAVGDKVEVHPMMYVALSYDHRLVDGKDSVTFLVKVKEMLEDPARLMLEV